MVESMTRHHLSTDVVGSIGDRAMRLLEGLTPGGSEFRNDPERCAHWVTERRKSEHDALVHSAVLRHRAEMLAALDAVIIDMVDGLITPFAWTDAMDSDGEYSYPFSVMLVQAVRDGRAQALEDAIAVREALAAQVAA